MDRRCKRRSEAAKTSATATKNVTKKSLVTMVQLLNKKVQANPSVTDALKLDAGFSVPDTSPTAVIAVGVATLNVNGYETGENKLKWSRSGNAPSVKFAVFASHDSGANWSQIAAITKTRFTHTGQTPGDAVWYKVVAYSANNTAPASPISVAYPEGSSNSLTLAA
ncbi:MAG: hypothetical protein K8R88_06895 [Armatimonadetes bacterium]|nr:hypothetical protein [Armatimonadota bacterium]